MFRNVKIEAAAAAAAATLVKFRSARVCPERLKRNVLNKTLNEIRPLTMRSVFWY